MIALSYHYDIKTGEVLEMSRTQLLKLKFKKIKQEKTFNHEKDQIIYRTGWERPIQQLRLFK